MGSSTARFNRDQLSRLMSLVMTQQFTALGLVSGGTPSATPVSSEVEGQGNEDDTSRRRRHHRCASERDDDVPESSRRRRGGSEEVDIGHRSRRRDLIELELCPTLMIPRGDSREVLASMIREICRLHLADDATWRDVGVATRNEIIRDIKERLAIATQMVAKYGEISIQHRNADARVQRRREKNKMEKKYRRALTPREIAYARVYHSPKLIELLDKGLEAPPAAERDVFEDQRDEDVQSEDDDEEDGNREDGDEEDIDEDPGDEENRAEEVGDEEVGDEEIEGADVEQFQLRDHRQQRTENRALFESVTRRIFGVDPEPLQRTTQQPTEHRAHPPSVSLTHSRSEVVVQLLVVVPVLVVEQLVAVEQLLVVVQLLVLVQLLVVEQLVAVEQLLVVVVVQWPDI
ncbi:hypothetical protein R1sor_015798 [Riccia sorocarpa]|uniref:Uncharacterized protein n=1 Tax=Riccia sorocarpa TaxID=122646 RepID=A0ABD3HGB1_9MARC